MTIFAYVQFIVFHKPLYIFPDEQSVEREQRRQRRKRRCSRQLVVGVDMQHDQFKR